MQNIHERLYLPRNNEKFNFEFVSHQPEPVKLGQVTLSGFDFTDNEKSHVSYYVCKDELTIPALQNLIRDLQNELAERLV